MEQNISWFMAGLMCGSVAGYLIYRFFMYRVERAARLGHPIMLSDGEQYMIMLEKERRDLVWVTQQADAILKNVKPALERAMQICDFIPEQNKLAVADNDQIVMKIAPLVNKRVDGELMGYSMISKALRDVRLYSDRITNISHITGFTPIHTTRYYHKAGYAVVVPTYGLPEGVVLYADTGSMWRNNTVGDLHTDPGEETVPVTFG